MGAANAYASDLSDANDYPIEVHKKAVPHLTKQVKAKSGNKDIWADHSDVGVAHAAQYRLTGTLPSNIDLWGTYSYKFTDTPDANMVIDSKSVKAYLVHDGKSTEIGGYAVSKSGNSISVAWKNLVESVPGLVYGDKICVEYSAHLKAGSDRSGQAKPVKNSATLEYTAENETGKTETTVPDTTESFTYTLTVHKKDESGHALAGAQFKLTDSDGNTISSNGSSVAGPASALTSDKDGDITVTGLDAGTYTLTETKAPDGYEACKPSRITVSSNASTMSDELKLKADVQGDAALDSVSSNTGVIYTTITDAASQSHGSIFHKTGNPLADWAWVLAAAVAAAIAAITHGIRSRRAAESSQEMTQVRRE
jgi:hypothetical protein